MKRAAWARLAAVAVVALTVAALVWALRGRREGLSLGGVGDFFKGVGQKVGAVGKNVVSTVKNVVKPKYQPTYVGRQWDGVDWSCPDGTVETGQEDAKGCITSQFHPPIWKPDGTGTWGHNCPTGTTPSTEAEWEKKCEIGHVGRVPTDAGWVCPPGTTDTGKNWDNSTWHEAQKQCQRSSAYTGRVMVNKKMTCPASTKDTGSNDKQCKWLAA